jgi:hypothetical protein
LHSPRAEEKRVDLVVTVEDGAPAEVMKSTDSGFGIPAEKQCLLFREFSQVDSSWTRRLAERMNGKMGMESKPGEGSRLWCDLPSRVIQGCGLRVPPGSRLGKGGLDGVVVDWLARLWIGPFCRLQTGRGHRWHWDGVGG